METNNITVDFNDGSLYEAIELHNSHVDKMLDFCRMLFNRFGGNDPVVDDFIEVFNSAAGLGIYFCCEANSREDEPMWSMYEDFHMVEDGADDE